MINNKKKQIMELGQSLQDDLNGSYRTTLRNRIIELRQKTQEDLKQEMDQVKMKPLEAMMRALMITDRILDKLFVSESHMMNSESRPIQY